MAETFVNVTEGSGKKLHTFDRTIGANSVHDEIVVLGENYLATYNVVTSVGGTSTATANSHLVQVMAGASLKVRVRRIEVYQVQLVTTATWLSMGLYRLSTAGTGGTAVTPAPMDTTDAASGATAMTLPTVKGTETTLVGYAAAWFAQTAGATFSQQSPIAVFDFEGVRSKPLMIAAGTANGIAVKNLNAMAAGLVSIVVRLDESNF